jgi:uncharacterized 2Fe-2S/4Fe-4S cluster protein (DUF4445 family)
MVTDSATVAPTVLPDQERRQGIALACRAVPCGDVTVAVPEDSHLRCIAPLLARYAAA